ncbi:MAG: PAS domain S-box protein [Spirochaetales bacterium]|nr:PAS domain S-box protein [Spirochaetales bacterium]
MTSETPGPERPAEIEELRARLAEAEETLRAIGSGEADALIFDGDQGQQVHVLGEGDRVYRQFIETISEGTATLSAGGDILSCNAFLAQTLRRPLVEILGTSMRDHLSPEDHEAFAAILAQAGTDSRRRKIRLKSSDGLLVPVYMSATLLQNAGAQPVTCLVLTDLEEVISAEEQIRALNAELEQRVSERTAQLEAANKELEAFAHSVSHDLRAPLRAIDGFSQAILADHAEKLDAEGNRLLNMVRSNTQRMDRLITDLLALTRAGRTALQLSRIDMGAMADSIYHEVIPPEVRGAFRFSLSPLPDAWGDPTQMRQVWANLLHNAVKFTLPKEARRIEITGSRDQGMNVYSVRDSGVGFDPAYAHKLFGMFQRLHRSEEFEGTGVGLAIVQRIIHRHGGRVWAEGTVEEGATFHFCLPDKEVNGGRS